MPSCFPNGLPHGDAYSLSILPGVFTVRSEAATGGKKCLLLLSPASSSLLLDCGVCKIHPSTLLWQWRCRAVKKTKSSSLYHSLYVSIWKRHWCKQVVRSLSVFLSPKKKCLPDLLVSVAGPLLVSKPPWWMATFPLFIAPLNHTLTMLLWPIFAALFYFPTVFFSTKLQRLRFHFFAPVRTSY